MRLLGDRFQRSQLLLKRLLSLSPNLMTKRQRLTIFPVNLKTQKNILKRENSKEKMQTQRLSKPRSRSWRRDSTTKRSHFWRKSLSMKR